MNRCAEQISSIYVKWPVRARTLHHSEGWLGESTDWMIEQIEIGVKR